MKIPLSEIRSATRDFTIPHNPGKVYKADLSHFNVDKYVAENKIKRVSMEEILKYPRIKSTVAIKSIDGRYGQRTEELLQTLLCLSHENLVKLVGFCDEDDGRIHMENLNTLEIPFKGYTQLPMVLLIEHYREGVDLRRTSVGGQLKINSDVSLCLSLINSADSQLIVDAELPVLVGRFARQQLHMMKEGEVCTSILNEDPSIRPTISGVIVTTSKVPQTSTRFEISEIQQKNCCLQVQSIQHMKIPLEEIRSATLEEIRSATRDMTIPHKPGKVYKAELSHFDVDRYVAENKIKRVSMEEILEYPRRKSTVAIKSIDGGYGQRTEELLQTLLFLSHENLVKLVGFCDEDDGRIHVVYEYASNRSLDEYILRQHNSYTNHIRNVKRNIFPWVIRLQFCLDAARGLDFLHNGNGKNDTIIHGNIKSSNILISREGVAMIGDFGLSTTEYINTHKLTKEYDVFSFGLVLFEVMAGRLTHFKISKDAQEWLPDQVKLGINPRKLNNIIDPMLQKEFEELKKFFF
ncbi:Phloem protein 2-like protein [Artemisia annua]|uniref:Phloem protein 2-like protein n=1 Tax=Artemisia annua TaxID=35608 RepID=A0A2U1Q545_ARTAN|nr:Phloem protein 2-like protein [Artemisia annua]